MERKKEGMPKKGMISEKKEGDASGKKRIRCKAEIPA